MEGFGGHLDNVTTRHSTAVFNCVRCVLRRVVYVHDSGLVTWWISYLPVYVLFVVVFIVVVVVFVVVVALVVVVVVVVVVSSLL